jgi:hypothetical protein
VATLWIADPAAAGKCVDVQEGYFYSTTLEWGKLNGGGLIKASTTFNTCTDVHKTAYTYAEYA